MRRPEYSLDHAHSRLIEAINRQSSTDDLIKAISDLAHARSCAVANGLPDIEAHKLNLIASRLKKAGYQDYHQNLTDPMSLALELEDTERLVDAASVGAFRASAACTGRKVIASAITFFEQAGSEYVSPTRRLTRDPCEQHEILCEEIAVHAARAAHGSTTPSSRIYAPSKTVAALV